MIGLSKPLSVTILAAAALLGGAPPGVQAQVRRFPMQHGMMMMPMQQNLTTMQAANLAMFNSMRPVFHHHHWMSPFQSSRMMGANNPYSTMAMLGGLYGMGYGTTQFGPASTGGITIQAAQNFTDTQQGTAITFSTTAINSANSTPRNSATQ